MDSDDSELLALIERVRSCGRFTSYESGLKALMQLASPQFRQALTYVGVADERKTTTDDDHVLLEMIKEKDRGEDEKDLVELFWNVAKRQVNTCQERLVECRFPLHTLGKLAFVFASMDIATVEERGDLTSVLISYGEVTARVIDWLGGVHRILEMNAEIDIGMVLRQTFFKQRVLEALRKVDAGFNWSQNDTQRKLLSVIGQECKKENEGMSSSKVDTAAAVLFEIDSEETHLALLKHIEDEVENWKEHLLPWFFVPAIKYSFQTLLRELQDKQALFTAYTNIPVNAVFYFSQSQENLRRNLEFVLVLTQNKDITSMGCAPDEKQLVKCSGFEWDNVGDLNKVREHVVPWEDLQIKIIQKCQPYRWILPQFALIFHWLYKRPVKVTFWPTLYWLLPAKEAWGIQLVLELCGDCLTSPLLCWFKAWSLVPRPAWVASDRVYTPKAPSRDYSFPSGHTCFVAQGTLLFALYFLVWYPFLIYAAATLIVGLSRVSLAVHWPQDIVVGAVMGTAIGVIAHFFALAAPINESNIVTAFYVVVGVAVGITIISLAMLFLMFDGQALGPPPSVANVPVVNYPDVVKVFSFHTTATNLIYLVSLFGGMVLFLRDEPEIFSPEGGDFRMALLSIMGSLSCTVIERLLRTYLARFFNATNEYYARMPMQIFYGIWHIAGVFKFAQWFCTE